jgi:hypothetical protein
MTILDKAIAPPGIGRFWQAVEIATLLGVLSVAMIAAIASPRIECQPIYLLTEDGQELLLESAQGFLISEDRQCRVVIASKVDPKDVTPWVTVPEAVARYFPFLDQQ